MALQAASDHLEIEGRTFGFADKPGAGDGSATTLVADMPADSLAAVSVANLGSAFEDMERSLMANPVTADGLNWWSDSFGLDLDRDLRALLGTESALALGPKISELPSITLRTRGGDVDRARTLLDLLESNGFPGFATLQRVSDGFVIGNDPTALTAAPAGQRLGDTPAFRNAVPDASGADLVAYVSLARLVEEDIITARTPRTSRAWRPSD